MTVTSSSAIGGTAIGAGNQLSFIAERLHKVGDRFDFRMDASSARCRRLGEQSAEDFGMTFIQNDLSVPSDVKALVHARWQLGGVFGNTEELAKKGSRIDFLGSGGSLPK